MTNYINHLGELARKSSQQMAKASSEQKNNALLAISDELIQSAKPLKEANQLDLNAGHQKGLSAALLERLKLSDSVIQGMAEGLRQIAALPDPIGAITDLKYRPTGIQLGKMRVPLGVIGIIFESRPNVTADAAGLCIKSGNACILRGGSEALHSNVAIAQCVSNGLAQVGLPESAVQMLNQTDRALVGELLRAQEYLDVIIPRGGKGLVQRVSEEARMPVIKHLDGNCHVYIEQEADLNKAVQVVLNAKTHRYGVCNAMESLLVDEAIASKVLPMLNEAMQPYEMEWRGCGKTRSILANAQVATEEDWSEEYLQATLSCKVVQNMDEAIEWINHYGSQHTDAIMTESYHKARRFLREVDSSSVMVNASTRFADGFEYGLGAEIGVSTDKLHTRGPVGVEGLTSEKYVVLGDGHIRQ